MIDRTSFVVTCFGLMASVPTVYVTGQSRPQPQDEWVVVENARPRWTSATAWRVEQAPFITIGVESGQPAYEFHRIRGVARLPDGRIAVADSRASGVRIFDSSGAYITAFGGPGGGPGEFGSVDLMWQSADQTIVVADGRLARITTFTPSGEIEQTVSVDAPGGFAGEVAPGAYVIVRGSRGMSFSDAGRVIQDSLRYALHTSSDEIVRVPDAARYGLLFGQRLTFPYLPFTVTASHATGSGRLAVGLGRTSEFLVWGAEGDFGLRVRWRAQRRAVTDEWRAAYAADAEATASSPNDVRAVHQLLREAPLPDHLPVYQTLVIDREGDVWVEKYRGVGETRSEWEVFDAAGTWLGTVEMPPGVTVSEIGPDYVLGVFRDALDVEYVHGYRLRKPGQR